jgi:NADH-quinone oxidoreductase subunit L
MFKMGGLRKKLPVIYWTFLIGAASLAALPFVTAGFYSKDSILWLAYAGEKGGLWFFAAALIGAFITSIYTFRMVFITFFGEAKTNPGHHAGKLMTVPLIILAVLSVVGGFIELPHTMGHLELFSGFLKPVLPTVELQDGVTASVEWTVQITTMVLTFVGLYIAYHFYVKKPALPSQVKASLGGLYQFWFSGWGFDALYDAVIVRPYVFLAAVNKRDAVDKFYTAIVSATDALHQAFARTQGGILRWYVMSMVIGAILILTLGLLL